VLLPPHIRSELRRGLPGGGLGRRRRLRDLRLYALRRRGLLLGGRSVAAGVVATVRASLKQIGQTPLDL
jgi:hypothetical protein